MRILIDMNLSPHWADFLTGHGYPSAHWSSIGRAAAADPEIMAYAASHDYVILTHDLDFGAILAVTHGRGPSVVQIRADDLSPQAIGGQIIAALKQGADALAIGALITVHPLRSRMTLLPLGGST